ncbi:MAG: L,D-transpeptidase [Thermoguttaceae bacterium]|nr:L,D-transpeptidase [Thermoguttaceae bacterium]
MPSLKSLLVLLALATIGYGVYTKLGQPGREVVWNTGISLKNSFFGENVPPPAAQAIQETVPAISTDSVASNTAGSSGLAASTNAAIPANTASSADTVMTRPFNGGLDLPNGSAPNPGDFLTEHAPMVPRPKDAVDSGTVSDRAFDSAVSPAVMAVDAVSTRNAIPSGNPIENASTAGPAEFRTAPLVMGGGSPTGVADSASPIDTVMSGGAVVSNGAAETMVRPASASLSMDSQSNGLGSLNPLRTPQEQELTQQLQAEAQRDIEFRRRMAEAHQRVDSGNTAEYERTLRELTDLYRHTSLNVVQRDELVQMLDDLAYGTIWSQNYYLMPPVKATGTETILQIASQCGISARLLIRINQLEGVVTDPRQPLPVGTVVKTLRGPFEAEISLERREMTVYVDQMYAGRFSVGFGTDFQPKTGTWPVVEKLKASDEAKSSVVVGVIQLDPASGLCLHGTPNAVAMAQGAAAGSILFSREDMADLLDILTRDPTQRFTSHVIITM